MQLELLKDSFYDLYNTYSKMDQNLIVKNHIVNIVLFAEIVKNVIHYMQEYYIIK